MFWDIILLPASINAKLPQHADAIEDDPLGKKHKTLALIIYWFFKKIQIISIGYFLTNIRLYKIQYSLFF